MPKTFPMRAEIIPEWPSTTELSELQRAYAAPSRQLSRHFRKRLYIGVVMGIVTYIAVSASTVIPVKNSAEKSNPPNYNHATFVDPSEPSSTSLHEDPLGSSQATTESTETPPSSNTTLTVNGQSISVPENGTVERTIESSDGVTSIQASNSSSSTASDNNSATSNSTASTHIDISSHASSASVDSSIESRQGGDTTSQQ